MNKYLFLTRASIAEAFLRMNLLLLLLLGLLTNFYHIFKESDYFESLACPKRKFVVGAAKKKSILRKSHYIFQNSQNIY